MMRFSLTQADHFILKRWSAYVKLYITFMSTMRSTRTNNPLNCQNVSQTAHLLRLCRTNDSLYLCYSTPSFWHWLPNVIPNSFLVSVMFYRTSKSICMNFRCSILLQPTLRKFNAWDIFKLKVSRPFIRFISEVIIYERLQWSIRTYPPRIRATSKYLRNVLIALEQMNLHQRTLMKQRRSSFLPINALCPHTFLFLTMDEAARFRNSLNRPRWIVTTKSVAPFRSRVYRYEYFHEEMWRIAGYPGTIDRFLITAP